MPLPIVPAPMTPTVLIVPMTCGSSVKESSGTVDYAPARGRAATPARQASPCAGTLSASAVPAVSSVVGGAARRPAMSASTSAGALAPRSYACAAAAPSRASARPRRRAGSARRAARRCPPAAGPRSTASCMSCSTLREARAAAVRAIGVALGEVAGQLALVEQDLEHGVRVRVAGEALQRVDGERAQRARADRRGAAHGGLRERRVHRQHRRASHIASSSSALSRKCQ